MLANLNVLLVDNDPEALERLEAALRPGRDQADARMSARAALDALRDRDFDLLLCDMRLAEDDDFEFVRIARIHYPGLAIILFADETGETPQSFADALKAGADGYFSKPLAPEKLALLFEHTYWEALSREDWWDAHQSAG